MKLNIARLIEAAAAVIADDTQRQDQRNTKELVAAAEYDAWWDRVARPMLNAYRDHLAALLAERPGHVTADDLEIPKATEPGNSYPTSVAYAPPSVRVQHPSRDAVSAQTLVDVLAAVEGETVSLSLLKSLGFTELRTVLGAYGRLSR